MWWLLLGLILVVWKNIFSDNRDLNTFNSIIVHHDTHGNHVDRVSYGSLELKRIGSDYLNSKHKRPPDYRTLRIIKDLRINARRIRLQKWKKIMLRKSNLDNLAQLNRDSERPSLDTKKISIGTVNVRSLKSSINHLLAVLHRENLDCLVVTETWLKNDDDSLSWLNAQGLKDLGYNHDNIPRRGSRRGGGIMLIYKSSFRLLASSDPAIQFCESRLWKLSTGKFEFTCLGVYHPPASSKDQVPDSLFIEKFVDATSMLLSDINNLLILGDFNLHMNDVTNDDAIDEVLSISRMENRRKSTLQTLLRSPTRNFMYSH